MKSADVKAIISIINHNLSSTQHSMDTGTAITLMGIIAPGYNWFVLNKRIVFQDRNGYYYDGRTNF